MTMNATRKDELMRLAFSGPGTVANTPQMDVNANFGVLQTLQTRLDSRIVAFGRANGIDVNHLQMSARRTAKIIGHLVAGRHSKALQLLVKSQHDIRRAGRPGGESLDKRDTGPGETLEQPDIDDQQQQEDWGHQYTDAKLVPGGPMPSPTAPRLYGQRTQVGPWSNEYPGTKVSGERSHIRSTEPHFDRHARLMGYASGGNVKFREQKRLALLVP